MAKKNSPVNQLFAPKGADKLYEAIVSKARARLGPRSVVEDPKQTCVHITAGEGGTAYAGLHPRKEAVLLNIRLEKPLKAERVRKVEQLSKNRYNCEMILSSVSDIDEQVLGWIADAWQLASESKPRRPAK